MTNKHAELIKELSGQLRANPKRLVQENTALLAAAPKSPKPASDKHAELIKRLMESCNGWPNAPIPWPHRLLHDAISALQASESAAVIALETVPSRELILGAVARGWCSKENSRKVMDSELALAIADEVLKLYTQPARAKPLPLADYTKFNEWLIEAQSCIEISTRFEFAEAAYEKGFQHGQKAAHNITQEPTK